MGIWIVMISVRMMSSGKILKSLSDFLIRTLNVNLKYLIWIEALKSLIKFVLIQKEQKHKESKGKQSGTPF